MTNAHFPDTVAIAGAGALGTALAHAFAVAGIGVAAVASRNAARAAELAAALPGTRSVTLAEVAMTAPIVIVAVSDSAIEAVAALLQPHAGTIVAHTSGSRPAATLDAVRSHGGVIGGFHPLAAVVRTPNELNVPSDAWRDIFRGAAFAIEGEGPVQQRLWALATALQGHPFAIAAADKPRYHLGASMLAAFSAGLSQIAWDGMRSAGATAAVASAGAGHLLRTVSENIQQAATPAAALTGPVARGDAGGVTRQANAAAALSAEAEAVYRVHARHSVAIALAARRIDPATAEQLMALLACETN